MRDMIINERDMIINEGDMIINERDMIINTHTSVCLHVKCRIFCQIFKKINFLGQIFKKYSKINFYKNI